MYNLQGELKSEEVRYGITSLPTEVAGAERLLAIVRAGWGIENKLHHQRDVQLAEDYCRLRRGNSNEVNAILNNTVLGLLNASGRRDTAQARREMEYNPNLALELLLTNFLSSD